MPGVRYFCSERTAEFCGRHGLFVNVLAAGATYIVVDTDTVKNPAKLTDFYASRKVTATFMTPSLFRSVAQFNPQMSWMEIGGEPCVKLFHDKIALYNGYSMSEAGRDILLFRIKEAMDLTPAGKNQGGEEILLMDEEGKPVPDGEIGEICFRNEYVRGYIGLPEKTAEAWRDGLFFTGDLGKRLPDGSLIIQGRNDDMIKIAGNRIEPEEIAGAAKRVLHLRWAVAKGFVTPERSF
ncbi:MAG: AMP-binding protein, partial [Parasporobacterium sp.]|nr:AMP-binding protein [Parasporobacterium sp.]